MTSSIAGVTGIGSSVAYAASKGALNIMTKSLARALAPKIRVNAICPGFIDTRWFGDAFGAEQLAKMRERVVASTPLQVASNAEDIADAALFLMSDASRRITGETLLADAGLHLGPPSSAATTGSNCGRNSWLQGPRRPLRIGARLYRHYLRNRLRVPAR